MRGRRAGAVLGAAAIVGAGCLPSYGFPGDAPDGGLDGSVPDAPVDAQAPSDTSSADAPFADTGPDAADANRPNVSLQGCVLLLHMDEPTWSGAGAVKDSSGANNHGSPVGSLTTTTAGKFGGAGSFDATGTAWIDVPDSPSLHAGTQVTYAAWIYPIGLTDGTPSPGIISKRRGYADHVAFTLFLWTSNEVWVDIQASRFASDFVFTNGKWFHVAVVYDGTLVDPNMRARLYVNGALDKPYMADPVLDSNVEDLLVGNLPGGGNSWNGLIDEVAIWTRALSDVEIKALAQATGPL